MFCQFVTPMCFFRSVCAPFAAALLLAGVFPCYGQENPLDKLIFEPIATRLERPTALANAGDGSGRLFIALQRGPIRVHSGERLYMTPFLDLTPKVGCCGENGLLGLAFHPNYEENGYFYVYYSEEVSGEGPRPNVVSRFRVSAEDPNRADPNSESILLRIEQPSNVHNAGQLAFGPGGYLYIGIGDGGVDTREDDPSQRLDNLLGKILRIGVDGGEPYAIPPDNPFADDPEARGEIWVYGLRNPFRFSFDRKRGDLFIGDVGSGRVEEVNFQAAESPGGENYGWGVREGPFCRFQDPRCETVESVPAILEIEHAEGGTHPRIPNCNASITAGYRYRGARMPEFEGVYFYQEFCRGLLFGATKDEDGWNANEPRQTEFCLSAFGEDEEGELYMADWYGGAVYRLATLRPVPALSRITPVRSVAGAEEFDLTVQGSLFVGGSEVRWNGQPRPTEFISTTRLRATISAADVAGEGAAQVSVFNPEPGGGITRQLQFEIEELPAEGPLVNEGRVVNGASFEAPVVPGSIVSVFGTHLAAAEETAGSDPLPTALSGSSARFAQGGEELRAPYFFASDQQLNIQVPWELAGGSDTSFSVRTGALSHEPVAVDLAEFSPAIFTVNQRGGGQGAVLIAGTGQLAGPADGTNSRPVHAGEFVEIFCTGLGPVEQPPPSGTAAHGPLSRTLTTPQVTIGGEPAPVVFSGLAPGFVGLYQVNAEVPAEAPPGEAVELKLTIGGVESNTVTTVVE